MQRNNFGGVFLCNIMHKVDLDIEGLGNWEVIVPHSVYPPREDTDLMAKRIISLGSGQGKNFLEIGSGSGALSILASSLGYNVHCCDINPFAVSATIGNLKLNHHNLYAYLLHFLQ